MKNMSIYRMLSVVMVLFAFTIQSCKDDDPTAVERATGTISSHPWKVSNVMVGDEDKTAVYQNVVLTVKNNKTFTSTNGGGIWPASGTWSFKDESAKVMSVSLGASLQMTDVTVLSMDGNTLKVQFQWDDTTLGGGRESSVAGEHVFTFVK